MKWLSLLLALANITLMASAGLSYGRAVRRDAVISSYLSRMRADCPTVDFGKDPDWMVKSLRESEGSFTNFVWFGALGLGLSIVGFVAGSMKRKEAAQISSAIGDQNLRR